MRHFTVKDLEPIGEQNIATWKTTTETTEQEGAYQELSTSAVALTEVDRGSMPLKCRIR